PALSLPAGVGFCRAPPPSVWPIPGHFFGPRAAPGSPGPPADRLLDEEGSAYEIRSASTES
ncbi:hypothetical protein, partial [Streptomyces cyaneofuscatus]|uniref:hypothetical protein n=1 Tax=Streptomyces cyaneofuscatus TaxID=66883 RepID=UPI0036A2889A